MIAVMNQKSSEDLLDQNVKKKLSRRFKMANRQTIRVKPDKDGKIIINLFGQEYEIVIDKETKKEKVVDGNKADK